MFLHGIYGLLFNVHSYECGSVFQLAIFHYIRTQQEQRVSYDVRVQFSDYSKDYLWLSFFFFFGWNICTQ